MGLKMHINLSKQIQVAPTFFFFLEKKYNIKASIVFLVLFLVLQVIDLYHPLALRLFLIGTHYRSPINYSDVLLEKASDRIFYIYQV